MKHIISCQVENKFGVLARISGLFSGRGFNITSLSVGATAEDPTISRMVIVTEGDEKILEQITKQLNKLIDVIKVQDLTGEDIIDREFMLIKLAYNQTTYTKLTQIVETFQCKVVSMSPKHLIVEIDGDEKKLNTFLDLIRPFGIVEIARTGKIAMTRVDKK